LGVSLLACAKIAEDVKNPSATTRKATYEGIHFDTGFEESQTLRCVLARDRTGCTQRLLLILPHYWMQAASAAVLRGDWARMRKAEMVRIGLRFMFCRNLEPREASLHLRVSILR
jgi:hypothetical protein